MEINRDGLERLLSLNDRQLKALVSRIAAQSGIDPREFNIDLGSVQSIRSALSSATDADIARIVERYNAQKGGGR